MTDRDNQQAAREWLPNEQCSRYGHEWAVKTDGNGKRVKVCTQCGTDELREAISILRYFQSICLGAMPIGQWPNERVCSAIDVVIDRAARPTPPESGERSD